MSRDEECIFGKNFHGVLDQEINELFGDMHEVDVDLKVEENNDVEPAHAQGCNEQHQWTQVAQGANVERDG